MVCEAAGLDVATYSTRDYIASRGVWGLIELFSDGELRVLAGNDSAAADRASVRQRSGQARHGEFYTKMSDLRSAVQTESSPIADELNKLARFCGATLAEYVTRGEFRLPDAKLARPGISARTGRVSVQFDTYSWQSTRDTAVILEYGPGVTGKKFLDIQLDTLRLQRRLPPFQYLGISDGPFINQFLVTYLGNRLVEQFGPEARQLGSNGRLFIGREDGMQQATHELLATSQPSGTHEMCDLILLTGVHRANPHELQDTIKRSPQLLHPEGKLMLSAPLDEVEEGVTPFAKQLGWAQESGYVPEWQQTVPTGNAALDTNTISGLAVLHR